jgi:hypothetical protein
LQKNLDSQAAIAASQTHSIQNRTEGHDSQAALAASQTHTLQNKAAGFDKSVGVKVSFTPPPPQVSNYGHLIVFAK